MNNTPFEKETIEMFDKIIGIIPDSATMEKYGVDTAMVKTQDVFLPYLVMADNRTLAENVSDGKFLLENKK